MAKLLRLESDSLPDLLRATAKHPEWHVVGGKLPEITDGPPYRMMIRELLPEELSDTGPAPP